MTKNTQNLTKITHRELDTPLGGACYNDSKCKKMMVNDNKPPEIPPEMIKYGISLILLSSEMHSANRNHHPMVQGEVEGENGGDNVPNQ